MPTMQSCSTLPQQQLLQQDGEVRMRVMEINARAALQLKGQSHSLIVDHIGIIMLLNYHTHRVATTIGVPCDCTVFSLSFG